MIQAEFNGLPLLTHQDIANTHVIVPVVLPDGRREIWQGDLFLYVDDPSEVRPEDLMGHLVEEDKNGEPTGRLRSIIRAVAVLEDGSTLPFKSLRPQ